MRNKLTHYGQQINQEIQAKIDFDQWKDDMKNKEDTSQDFHPLCVSEENIQKLDLKDNFRVMQ